MLQRALKMQKWLEEKNLRGDIGSADMKILYGLLTVMVTLIVLGSSVPVLWPIIASSGDNITAMTGTDQGTVFIQTFWPIVLMLVGLGVAVGLIIFAIKKFKTG